MHKFQQQNQKAIQVRKLQLKNYIGFGLGDLAFNLFFQGVTLFLLFFYTDILGIEASIAGTIFLVATIWDAISDPIVGWIASNTRSRWGRYRGYLLWIPIPLGISYVLLFYQPNLTGWALIAWVGFLQILFRTNFTLANIPYSSLSSEMTFDPAERSQLAMYRMFLGYAGALIVSVGTGVLMSKMGWLSEEDGYLRVAIVAAIVAAILFFICFKNTFELPQKSHQSNLKLKDALAMIRQNPPFWKLNLFVVVGMAGVVFLYQSLAYYFKYNLGNEAALGSGMLYLFIVLMLALPFWLKLTTILGKPKTLMLGCAVLMIGSLGFYFHTLTNASITLTYIYLAILGCGIGCMGFSFWAMLPDTVEYGEWKTGVRAEAIIFGFGLFFLKIGLGLGSFVLGLLLNYFGYVPNATQAVDTLSGLHSVATLAMFFPALITFVIMLRYSLSAVRYREILMALDK